MDVVWSKDRLSIGILATDMAEIANSLHRGHTKQAMAKFQDFEQTLRHSAGGRGSMIVNLEVYPYTDRNNRTGMILRGTSIEINAQKNIEDIGNHFGLKNILHFVVRFCNGELGNVPENIEDVNKRLMSSLNSGEIPIIKGMVQEFLKWNGLVDNIFKFDIKNKVAEKIKEIDNFLSNTKTTAGMVNVEGVGICKNMITKTDIIISLRP